ncbi:Ufd2P_core domain-containing protein [Meloidogyne graminicola]|uniref:Ufd2P_core domain-containing protein n=1 Tax=Meloidogyne graminicola TaxID=189291 RepID=A0A8S9ZVW9_9BILA|nr:Ufd2P_core domain-containing protein [Meloidogyne graminicola]
MDTSEHLEEEYFSPLFKDCSIKAASTAFDYIFGLYGRSNGLVNQSQLGLSAKIYSILSERVKIQFILFLRGLLHVNFKYWDISKVFTKFLLKNVETITLFVHDIIACCRDITLTDGNALSEVFCPVLDILRFLAIHSNMMKRFEGHHLSLLVALLEIKMSNNTRPLANLLVSRPDFHPKKLITNFKGREFVHSSFLGPFFAFSVAGKQSHLYEFCFDHNEMLFNYDDMENKGSKISEFQTQLRMMRIKMHQIFHSLIVNSSTRSQTLEYISEIFLTNKKLSQIQVEYEQLANPTAILNLLSILLDFDKIPVEKIQDDYIYHPKCRIKLTSMNTLKMDSDMVETYCSSIDLSYTPSFNTECFYLTIAFMGISMTTMINNLSRMDRHIYEIRRQLREAEEQLQKKGQSSVYLNRVKAIIQRTKELLKRFTLSNVCYDCLINDHDFLSKCAHFTNKVLRLYLRSIMPDSGVDPFSFKPCIERFTALPEVFLETAVEFLHFLLENPNRSKVLTENVLDYPRLILHLIVNLPLVRNPFLASKIVNILYSICPNVPSTNSLLLYRQIMNDKIAVDNLFPVLVKFYADVESTGSHTEFYDKFNIRRNIQVIFRFMWVDLTHRKTLVQFAEKSSPDFCRFLNMVINDTTFLLDESLEKLKKINEIETQLSNETVWNSLSEEERQHRTEMLSDAKRQVRIWLSFGTETMELFLSLTGDAPQISSGGTWRSCCCYA